MDSGLYMMYTISIPYIYMLYQIFSYNCTVFMPFQFEFWVKIMLPHFSLFPRWFPEKILNTNHISGPFRPNKQIAISSTPRPFSGAICGVSLRQEKLLIPPFKGDEPSSRVNTMKYPQFGIAGWNIHDLSSWICSNRSPGRFPCSLRC